MNTQAINSPNSALAKVSSLLKLCIIDFILLIFVLVGSYRLCIQSIEAFGVDYYQFWAIADEASQGNLGFVDEEGFTLDKFYNYFYDKYSSLGNIDGSPSLLALAVENRKEVVPTGTPFFYAAIKLLSLSDYEYSLRLFQFLSSSLFCFAIIYIMSCLSFSRRRGLLFFIYLLLFFEPLNSDIRVTNVNQFEIGLIGISLLLLCSSSKPLSATAGMMLLVLLAFFKPNMIIAVVVLLLFRTMSGRVERLRSELFGVILALPIGTFLHDALLVNGPSWYNFYRMQMHLIDSGSYGRIMQLGNYSIMKLFVVWSQVDEELFYYLLVGGAIFFVSSIFVLIAQNKKMAIPGSELSVVDESIAAIGIGSAFFLLVSPLAWIHYYLLIVPLLLYLMKPSTQVKSTGRLFRIVSFTAIGCALLILSMEQIAVYLGNTEFKMTVTLNEFIAVKALSISLLIVVALIQHLSQTGYISLSRSEK